MGYGRKHPDSRLPQNPALFQAERRSSEDRRSSFDYSGALPANLRRVEIVTSNPSWDLF